MSKIEVKLPIYPIAFARPRPRKGGGYYDPERYAKFKQDFGLLLKPHAPRTPWTGPVNIELEFYVHRKKPMILLTAYELDPDPHYHTGVPDLDNLIKAVMDSCNGILFEDDKQVCLLEAGAYTGTY